MNDYKVGVTAPPFHPNCRTCTCPYFDDDFLKGDRAARGKDGKTYYVPSDMKYSEWKEKYVVDAISEQARNDFEKYKIILGENSPSIDKFPRMRYDKNEWKMFNAYTSSIKSGELSALADFDLYKRISRDIDYYIVGIFTSNNIKITDKSNHFIARTIGSIEQKRSGATIADIVDALLKPVFIDDVRELKNGRSQRFISDKVLVTVNPDTGMLIQVNPRTRRKKVNQ